MDTEYRHTVARHYSAYRPALHTLILERLIECDFKFNLGLDIGCGTGHSTRALTPYCRTVLGIDPSLAMLEKAAAGERTHYLAGAGDAIPLQDDSVDLVSFAGSLCYAKSCRLLAELSRICRDNSLVCVYDFEIILDEIVDSLGIESQANNSDYDHALNFSDTESLMELDVQQSTIEFSATAEEIAHILLSETERHSKISESYDGLDPHPRLCQELESLYCKTGLAARVWAASYRISSAGIT